jgi:hypothetical protein
MASRQQLAGVILLIGLTTSIYFFIIQEDDVAINALFIGIYGTVSVLFFLKVTYYAQYKATLNEIYFIVFSNLIPIGIIGVSPYIPLGQSNIFEIDINSNGLFFDEITLLRVSLLSLLCLPYILVAIGLLIRSFTRYEFIRYTSQSSKGPSAEWTAIISFIVFGILFIIIGGHAKDILSLFFGFYFIVNGVGFFIGRI